MIRRRPHYLLHLELIHLRFHFFPLSFPSFPRYIPFPLEPAFIIVTLSTFTLLHLFRTCFSPRIYIFPSLPIPSNYPFQPPPHKSTTLPHLPPNLPRKPYSSQRPTPRPQSIPAPNSPHSIPHFNPTPSLLKHAFSHPWTQREKKQSATGCRSMRLEEGDGMVRVLRWWLSVMTRMGGVRLGGGGGGGGEKGGGITNCVGVGSDH